MMTNEIPMDSLMALAAERRARYTDEAAQFRLGRQVPGGGRPGLLGWLARVGFGPAGWLGRGGSPEGRESRPGAPRLASTEPGRCS